MDSNGSELVESFWAGKLVQQMKLTREELHVPHGELMDPSTPPQGDYSDQSQAQSLAAMSLEEALSCLTRCATSLSPRVCRILHSRGTGGLDGPPLHSEDGTIDWNRVTCCFSTGMYIRT
jgi:hypothetical protein